MSSKQLFDKNAGDIIRANRRMHGMTQTDMAKKMGVTFQQVQKYEKGTNSLAAWRLIQVGEILGISPAYFYSTVAPQDSIPLLYIDRKFADNFNNLDEIERKGVSSLVGALASRTLAQRDYLGV